MNIINPETSFCKCNIFQIEQFPLLSLDGRVEVRVEYGGINFADLYTRQGIVPKVVPFVLGVECSGTIQAIGDGVTQSDLQVRMKRFITKRNLY